MHTRVCVYTHEDVCVYRKRMYGFMSIYKVIARELIVDSMHP